MYLPREIWYNIFEYDLTYKSLYDNVMNEIILRYADGKWWIKRLAPYVYGSRIYYDGEWSSRERRELCFLSRSTDLYGARQYFNLKDVLLQIKYNK